MGQWIKKGDKVKVIAGNDRGRTGNVLRIKGERMVIQGINIHKKHVKRRTEVQTPTILEIEVAIHRSNVTLCDEEGKPIKLKKRLTQGGGKELYYLRDGKEILFRTLRKEE